MQLLYLASECAPFIKTGGLADVIGAVPKALSALGLRSRILLPAYRALDSVAAGGRQVWQHDALFGGPARLLACEAQGLELLLLDAPHLYHRDGGPYQDLGGRDYDDNAQRFAALAWVGAQVAIQGVDSWRPDLVHAHDWQASLVAAYLEQMPGAVPPCITTIHNIAFQGLFDPGLMPELGLSGALFKPDGLEFYGRLGFLKAGLVYSHAVTTVSPTYAKELMRPEFGMGLEGVLHARQAAFHGILNGIDLEAWNPADDLHLAAPYSADDLAGKVVNKEALSKRFGIVPAPDQPLFCVISRLTRQKGLDLLLNAIPALVGRGAKLVILGTGDSDLEAGFKAAARSYPEAVGCVIGYDEGLSHLMQGGADAILIPSRFEPCGLTQLYGLRYGTLPVVARTGGLADTVIDANQAALARGWATGVLHDADHFDALLEGLFRACDLYSQPERWRAMVQAAMSHPVGWQESALAYRALYRQVLGVPADGEPTTPDLANPEPKTSEQAAAPVAKTSAIPRLPKAAADDTKADKAKAAGAKSDDANSDDAKSDDATPPKAPPRTRAKRAAAPASLKSATLTPAPPRTSKLKAPKLEGPMSQAAKAKPAKAQSAKSKATKAQATEAQATKTKAATRQTREQD